MDDETQRKIMQHIGKVFEQRMNSALIGGDAPQTEYTTTTQSQPSEPMTVEKLEHAMKLLRETVPPNPYKQYEETHEWHFPARLQREIEEACQSPTDSLLGSRLIDRLYGIPIVWDYELIDRCELRPSPERIARYLKRLEMQKEMEAVNKRFLTDELTQRDFSLEIGQIMERYLIEHRDNTTPHEGSPS
jgi:hypothetical protein